jgi:hypothetical protein
MFQGSLASRLLGVALECKARISPLRRRMRAESTARRPDIDSIQRICEKQPDGDKTGGNKGQEQTYELVHKLISYSIVVVGTRIDARYLSPQ